MVDGAAGRAAIIGRLDRKGRLLWSLPKGHIEAGETPDQTAVREVEEETGIIGRVVTPIGTIDYWFVAGNRRVHKTVHHFLLKATGGYLTTEKDPDHEAIDVAWSDIDDLGRKLSFPNERRIADIAREYIIHQI